MELKVGDYVRLKRCQGINRIEEYDEDIKKYIFEDCIGDEWGEETDILDENDVIKSSPNIIDLIELGDLVKIEVEKDAPNVFEVVAIAKENNEIGIFNNNFEFDWASIEQLKSIVTKEQFESMEYKV